MVRNCNSISTEWLENTLKVIRTTSVSALFSCFGLFDIAGQTQYTYIVRENKIHSYLLQNKKEQKQMLF
jgi:hypothetical protein